MVSKGTNKIQRELSPAELQELLFSYAPRIAEEKRLDRLLVLMADMGRQMVIADRCSLWLLDQHKNEVWTKVAHGVGELRMPADLGMVGYCIQNDHTVITNDPYSHPHFNSDVDLETGYHTRSMIVIPIRDNEGKVMGAYQAVNKMSADASFTDLDMKHLSLTSVYSGKSIESAMLYREIEDTQKEIIFTMGEVGESRSRETGNHVKRVAESCYLLARYLGLEEDEAQLIKLASPMHDIGKISIPDSILKKPGRLTAEEFEIMKTHAQVGYEILKNSKRRILRAAATIAWSHQEKYNGLGYPRGTQGDEIPLYGRICAVADVFDALANDRCYKKAWPIEKIVSLFVEERNQHFDGRLVDILLDHLDEFVQINETFRDVNSEEAKIP